MRRAHSLLDDEMDEGLRFSSYLAPQKSTYPSTTSRYNDIYNTYPSTHRPHHQHLTNVTKSLNDILAGKGKGADAGSNFRPIFINNEIPLCNSAVGG